MSVEFGGTLFETMRDAAKAWAVAALPDTSVVDADETAHESARHFEYEWAAEAAKVGPVAPDGVDEDAWRAACRSALVTRILRARGAEDTYADPLEHLAAQCASPIETEADLTRVLRDAAALATDARAHALAMLLRVLADEPGEVAGSRAASMQALASMVHPDTGERAIVRAVAGALAQWDRAGDVDLTVTSTEDDVRRGIFRGVARIAFPPGFVRMSVPLKPGEVAPPEPLDMPAPDGCRWETDAELRARIVGAIGDPSLAGQS